MRVVSWNCNGAFRNKLHKLEKFNADLYVIQECENPSQCASVDYKSWAGNYLWCGTNKNRGLGVFAKNGMSLEQVPLDTSPLELFISCRVNESISVLAVWTREAKSPTFGYIGQLWKFLQRHPDFLATENSVLIGDLNSNACWDVWDRWWNHSDVVRHLQDVGLESVYHHIHAEKQGSETWPTFYKHRKVERPYHIDYAFLSARLLQGAACSVGDPSEWLEVSDHMPLVVDLL